MLLQRDRWVVRCVSFHHMLGASAKSPAELVRELLEPDRSQER